MVTKCAKCGQKLTTFMIYIPGVGETCLKCYTGYAIDEEKKAVAPKIH